MEDARITHSKKALKQALVSQMDSHKFDEITVTDICNKAGISRITFYKHYPDKYALVEDLFQDMAKEGDALYRTLQLERNPSHDLDQGFVHVISAMIAVVDQHMDLFRHINPADNPFISSTFFHTVLKTVEHHTIKESYSHKMNFTAQQITGFLCYGLVGFVLESKTNGRSFDNIQQDVERLMLGLLASNVLFDVN